MILIKRYPGRVDLHNYELGDCPKLESSLSVWDPVYHTVSYSAYVYDEENKILTIPGGYNMEYLEQILSKSYKIDESNRNIREPYNNVSFSLKYPTRNTTQNKAINFLMVDCPQKFLSLQTGGGKTYCAIHYVFKSKKLPLTLVDQDSICQQWIDKILYFTTIKREEIYVISGKDSIEKILKMNDKDLKKYKWFIAIHRTLSNIIETECDKLINAFKKIKIGVKLYDEAHVEYRNIFSVDRIYDCESIYITATPTRGNPNENKVYQNMFNYKSVPKFVGGYEKYLNVLVYKYNTSPTYQDEIDMSSKYGFNTIAWCNYILQDNFEYFTECIEDVLNTVYKKNKHKVAILMKSIDMCDKVFDDFQDYLKEKGLTSGKYHSKVKNKDDSLDKDVIFTTEKSFGKALDVKGLSVCINTVPCSSEATVLQIMGRLREIPDKEVFFIDMYDAGFAAQTKQAGKRNRIYKNKAKKIYNTAKK